MKRKAQSVEVRIKCFRGVPVIPGSAFFTTGKVKHPDTLVIPNSELNDLVEVVAQESPQPVEETTPEPPVADDFLE